MGARREDKGNKGITSLVTGDMLGRNSRGGTLLPRERGGGARVALIISTGCRVVESSLERGLADSDKGASGRESLEERKGSVGLCIIIRDETGGGVRSPIVERKQMTTWKGVEVGLIGELRRVGPVCDKPRQKKVGGKSNKNKKFQPNNYNIITHRSLWIKRS